MGRKIASQDIPHRLRTAGCAFGLLLSLAALPAFGQHAHQLSYNGSTGEGQNLGGAQTYFFSRMASILTTPNHHEHVYDFRIYPDHGLQLFHNGTNWSDEDLTSETCAP